MGDENPGNTASADQGLFPDCLVLGALTAVEYPPVRTYAQCCAGNIARRSWHHAGCTEEHQVHPRRDLHPWLEPLGRPLPLQPVFRPLPMGPRPRAA